MSEKREISVSVPVLARVEGEGALELQAREGAIERLELRIFEPPRLFEKFLQGRSYEEVPDMVARICGICPVAYQMSASHAIESAFGMESTSWIREMRRLFYCGEWIESHSLHIHLLAAPDFFGYDDAITMARDYPEEVRRGLRLQDIGNSLIRLWGGRSVHPVGARIGGFFRAPDKSEVESLLARVRGALPEAEQLIDWIAAFDVPEGSQAFTSVALRHPDEYPMNEGRIVSSSGLDIPIEQYEQHFAETQVPYSNAFHARLDGQPYLVGPLARLNLNLDRLPQAVQECIQRSGIRFPSHNMFHSALARAIEIYYALWEAIRILEAYYWPQRPAVDVQVRSGMGYGCTEAPRGLLWHRYELDETGRVVNARIVPPTSQNQARIEEDLRTSLQDYGLHHSDDQLRHRAEAIIRNYDPCISCSTHFLRLRVQRD